MEAEQPANNDAPATEQAQNTVAADAAGGGRVRGRGRGRGHGRGRGGGGGGSDQGQDQAAGGGNLDQIVGLFAGFTGNIVVNAMAGISPEAAREFGRERDVWWHHKEYTPQCGKKKKSWGSGWRVQAQHQQQ